jgi:hypothetical protein
MIKIHNAKVSMMFLGTIIKIRNAKFAVDLAVPLLNSRNFRSSNPGRETHFGRSYLWFPIIPIKQIVP